VNQVAAELQAALDRPITGGAAEKLEHLRDRVRRAVTALTAAPGQGPYSDMGGIASGHPFHLQLPDGVVLRGRVDPACEAELTEHGVTVNEVFAALQVLRDQHDDGQYTIELKGPVDVELFTPNVAHDEIDEDPTEPRIVSAPGGVLYSDGSMVEPDDSDAPDSDSEEADPTIEGRDG
jgi:hypothetical protein